MSCYYQIESAAGYEVVTPTTIVRERDRLDLLEACTVVQAVNLMGNAAVAVRLDCPTAQHSEFTPNHLA